MPTAVGVPLSWRVPAAKAKPFGRLFCNSPFLLAATVAVRLYCKVPLPPVAAGSWQGDSGSLPRVQGALPPPEGTAVMFVFWGQVWSAMEADCAKAGVLSTSTTRLKVSSTLSASASVAVQVTA